MSKSDQLRALRERGVKREAEKPVAMPARVVTWLAPVGQCEHCDRRRAASIEKMKAYRARKKSP